MFIRAMGEGDLDAVMAIAASRKDAPQWKREAYVEAIEVGRPLRRVALVAEDNGVAGFVVGSVVGPSAEVESIAVARSAQRRGVATALLKALFDAVREVEAADLMLEVRASNAAAIALYGKLGFAESGRRRNYYRDPDEDAVLMKVEL